MPVFNRLRVAGEDGGRKAGRVGRKGGTDGGEHGNAAKRGVRGVEENSWLTIQPRHTVLSQSSAVLPLHGFAALQPLCTASCYTVTLALPL